MDRHTFVSDPVNVLRRTLSAWLLMLALPAWAQVPPRIVWIWPGREVATLSWTKNRAGISG